LFFQVLEIFYKKRKEGGKANLPMEQILDISQCFRIYRNSSLLSFLMEQVIDNALTP